MLDYERRKDHRICFKIKKEIYPLKAVYRAAYLFTDNYYIGIDQNEEEYIILFSGKEKEADEKDLGDFQNELLNQCMKLAIDRDTRQIRELIVTRALYSAFIPQDEQNLPEENKSFASSDSESCSEGNDEYHLEEIAEAWSNYERS